MTESCALTLTHMEALSFENVSVVSNSVDDAEYEFDEQADS